MTSDHRASLPEPVRIANRRVRVSLRPGDWPEADQSAWRTAFTSGDLFDERGDASHLSAATRTALENVYGRWLGFLRSIEGGPLAHDPGARVTRDRVRGFILHLAETNRGSSIASQLGHLRAALQLVAANTDWRWLLLLKKRVAADSPKQSKRQRLRTSDALHQLGLDLMERAELQIDAEKRVTKEAALLYRDGLIIAFLSETALRRRNLTGLAIGNQLAWNGEHLTVVIEAGETKNREALEFPLSDVLARATARYLAAIRPTFCGSERHNGLWASAKGSSMSGAALYGAVCRRTEVAFGQAINLHLFRDAAATFWALKAPGAVRGVSALLGHKDPRSTRHYNQAGSIQASRAAAALIGRKRISPASADTVHRLPNSTRA